MFEAESSPISISAGQVTDDTNNSSASNFLICTRHATRMFGTTLQILLFPIPAVLIIQAFKIYPRDLSAHQTQISNLIHSPAHHLKRRFWPLIPICMKTSKRSAGQNTAWLFFCVYLLFPNNRYSAAALDPDPHYSDTMQQLHWLSHLCHPERCCSTSHCPATCLPFISVHFLPDTRVGVTPAQFSLHLFLAWFMCIVQQLY